MRINDIVLLLLIVSSFYFDLTTKKIPNIITLPVILWGLVSYTIFEGLEGLIFSGLGLVVGLLIFIIPFLLGGMGGGDVKLMASIGALNGWRFVLYTAIYTGLVGGIIVVVLLISEKKLWITIKRTLAIMIRPIAFFLSLIFNNNLVNRLNNWIVETHMDWEKRYLPYGVAIGIGAVLTYFFMR